jgi:hypothetical protein
MNKLSWNDTNTLPYKEGDTNLNKFMSLVLREIRNLGYTKYVDPQQLVEFIEVSYEDDDDSLEQLMNFLFTTPQNEAKEVAESYIEMYSQEESDFE